jgi:hypothetical protein
VHFGHLHWPNPQQSTLFYVWDAPNDYPCPAPLTRVTDFNHGCGHLKECGAGNVLEGDAFNNARLQTFMAVSLVDLRLSTARSNLQHHLTMRALIACSNERDHGLQDYRGELDKRIQEAHLEVKHLESQLKNFHSSVLSPAPLSFIPFNPIPFNPITRLLSQGKNVIKAGYKPLNFSFILNFMGPDWRGTRA